MTRPPSLETVHGLPHAQRADEAIAAVESDAAAGLAPDEAARRLERAGPNALPETRRRTLPAIFLGQFASPLIYLLFVAAGIALALGHTGDAVVIFVVVLVNAVIGALQEGRAEHSLAALRRLATHEARVVRGGRAADRAGARGRARRHPAARGRRRGRRRRAPAATARRCRSPRPR